ncbi:uroporphyrinogen-III synthase [Acidobacteria bacterium AB60]|nr:uroporphyrinogen-III synthase [Acidobacteria bacterium AB60]
MPSLAGRRILVTRAIESAGNLSESLRALGAEPVEVPLLGFSLPEDPSYLLECLRRLRSYDWLIFTSATAVRMFFHAAQLHRISLTDIPGRIAAVGPATARQVVNEGWKVDFIPEKYVAENLVAGFPEEVKGKRLLLARSALARDVIPSAFRAAGAVVDAPEAYRNVLPENAPEALKQALAKPLNAATFTSSSSVTHLAEAANKANIPFPLAGVPAISIGPITTQTLQENNWPPAAEAHPHDIPGLVAAVEHVLTRT